MEATEYLAVNLERVRHTLRPRVFLELAILHLCQQPKATMIRVPVYTEKGLAAAISKREEAEAKAQKIPEMLQPQPQVEPKEEPKVVPQVVAVQPEGVPKAVVTQPKAEAQQATTGDFNPAKVWNDAVGYITEQGKRAIGSCAKNGRGVAFDGKVLTVLVRGNQFVADRLSKDDYRKILEDAILAMQRVPVKCEFVTEFAGPVPEVIPQEGKETVAVARQELPDVVQKALDAFGGEIKKK